MGKSGLIMKVKSRDVAHIYAEIEHVGNWRSRGIAKIGWRAPCEQTLLLKIERLFLNMGRTSPLFDDMAKGTG